MEHSLHTITCVLRYLCSFHKLNVNSFILYSNLCPKLWWFRYPAVISKARKSIGRHLRLWLRKSLKIYKEWEWQCGFATPSTTKTWVRNSPGEACWWRRWSRYSRILIFSIGFFLSISMFVACRLPLLLGFHLLGLSILNDHRSLLFGGAWILLHICVDRWSKPDEEMVEMFV